MKIAYVDFMNFSFSLERITVILSFTQKWGNAKNDWAEVRKVVNLDQAKFRSKEPLGLLMKIKGK